MIQQSRLLFLSCWLATATWGAEPTAGSPRHLQVDPVNGNDTSGTGPFKTIARAIKLAQPGDTIDLASSPTPYYATAEFLNRSGEPGWPITLDGHGATLDGSEPMVAADWEQVSPGLYRNSHLLPANAAVLMRWYFLFDGRMNHMNRTSKGPKQPFKKPEELAPGEWTFAEEAVQVKSAKPSDAKPIAGAFYIKIDPAKALADYHIAAPLRPNGVALGGHCSHLVIRNITATHVHNDGFNIHGTTRDILFENITAVDCGDDGFSAHDDCEVRIDGFVSMRNSTGIANVGNCHSENNRVFVKDCLGIDLWFMGYNTHTLSNSVIVTSAARGVVIDRDRSTNGLCRMIMENVLIQRGVGTNGVQLANGTVFEGRRLTIAGLNLTATGDAVTLRDSILAGSPQPELIIGAQTKWQADNNLYDLQQLRVDKSTYTAKTFGDFQNATGQEKTSRWMKVEFAEPFDGRVLTPVLDKSIGAQPVRSEK